MAPKRSTRASTRAAKSSESTLTVLFWETPLNRPYHTHYGYLTQWNDNYGLISMIGEDDITSNDNTGEHVDVKKPVRGKRAAPASDRSEKKAKAEPPGRPLYSHWLMKSEPESRLENGIDVKARWFVPRWPHSLSDWISSHIGVLLCVRHSCVRSLISISIKFGIEDLKALPDQTGCWDGVRNYQVDELM